MPTQFLDAAGTNGFIATPFNLLSTEAGFGGLANGSAVTSSVGGASGVFTQTNFAQAIWGRHFFVSGGAFTPTAGGVLAIWYLESYNGGTTYEGAVAIPSTTAMALPRAPDVIIPLDAVALASGTIKPAGGFQKLPWETCKVVLQNLSGATLPSSGNLLLCGPVATQY